MENLIAAHHLLWIWRQYGEAKNKRIDGKLHLWHGFMKAGEDAADWLEEMGLGEHNGDFFVPNEKGLDIMERHLIELKANPE